MIPLHPAENHKAHSVFARILDAQLIAAYSLRTDGNMSLGCGDTAHALEDRERFLSRLGIGRYAIVCCRQVHGDRVVRVRRIDAGRGARDNESAIPACDALITNEREVPLAVFTADSLTAHPFRGIAP